MQRTIAIVIPAYNEADNLPILVETISHVLPTADIIIVDDSSNGEHERLLHGLTQKKADTKNF